MDRQVKARLLGAAILAALIVSIVPELLPGPVPPPIAPKSSAREPVRNVTVDLATSKAPEPEPAADAASSAQPAAARETVAASASGAPPVVLPPAAPPAPPRLETAAPAPTVPAAAAKSVSRTGGWAVQLGSFGSRANAEKLTHQLHAQGFAVYVVPGGSGFQLRYRVRVGPMADRSAAAQTIARLKSLGHAASIVPPAP